MTKISMYFECEQEHLGQIMIALAPELQNVSGLKIETIQSELVSQIILKPDEHNRLRSVPVHTGDRSIYNPNWKSNHTTSKTQGIIIDVLRVFEDKTASFDVLNAALENHKFKASSRSPALTNLKAAGIVTVNGLKRTVTLIKEP